MIQADNSLPRAKSWWRAAWPIWTLTAFAALALTNQLPSGVARAVLAAPILLAAPGALTIGAVLDQRWRPQGASVACLAGLLSVLWSVFASLALCVLHFLITAESTYWCLLAVCAGLAIAAQVRLLSERSDTGRRAVVDARIADRLGTVTEEISDTSGLLGTGPEQPDPPGALRRFGYIGAAVVAGPACSPTERLLTCTSHAPLPSVTPGWPGPARPLKAPSPSARPAPGYPSRSCTSSRIRRPTS